MALFSLTPVLSKHGAHSLSPSTPSLVVVRADRVRDHGSNHGTNQPAVSCHVSSLRAPLARPYADVETSSKFWGSIYRPTFRHDVRRPPPRGCHCGCHTLWKEGNFTVGATYSMGGGMISDMHCRKGIPIRQSRPKMPRVIRDTDEDSSEVLVDDSWQRGKRKVLEHIVLLKMKESLSEEAEKDMLDHIYTLQYRVQQILAISLGRIFSKRSMGFTHAIFIRFPDTEALSKYHASPFYDSVMKTYVDPHCDEVLLLDFEAEVEDDIEPVFRRGEDWNRGIEHVVLLKLKEMATEEDGAAMLEGLRQLPDVVGDSIIQLTAGKSLSLGVAATDNSNSVVPSPYTHGLIVRFPSEEDLRFYEKHPDHRQVLKKLVLPICAGMLILDFRVDPVGERLM